MAIQISGTTVIDNARKFIPVTIEAAGSVGSSGQVLSSTGTGVAWVAPSTGGGSGSFDTGISSSVYLSVSGGSSGQDIFSSPATTYTFPAGSFDYVVESVHVANSHTDELYLVARHDYGATKVPIAQRVLVPYQGSVDLLEQPFIASPSDVLSFQALSGVTTSATGVDSKLNVVITVSQKTDTNYIGVGATVTTTPISSASEQTIYTSSTYPTVVQSIRLINFNLNIDIDATISVYRSSTRLGYLTYGLTIPKNSTVELCQNPKYLATNDSIRAAASYNSGLSVCVSGKLVV